MINKYKTGILGMIALAVLSLAAFKSSQAQTSLSTDAADAIAVRVIPNPNHYSISRWYEAQGFQGSPQALIVDGYEAIRDGRTVYVNAANVDTNSRIIYTNIYLISYNQNPAPKTVDILGQIVAHWKFNGNIAENTNPAPSCSISATSCNLDADCASDQYCATSSASVASSSCLLKSPKNCLVDTDCPNTLFCNSIKSRITRDIKRVGQLEELKEALFNFKTHNNYYPRLSSGTYLANNSLSVWPSWTQSLLSEVAVSQNFLDPINRLGTCLGYDAKTCWNPDLKKFIYNPTGGTLILPAGSYAFAYSADANGSNYNLCAVMESRETGLNYHFSPNDPASSACVTATGIISGGQSQNTAPKLVDQFLIGQANQPFSGFLKVIDLEGNPLTWSISGQPWVSLQDTSDPTQKKIYASSAAAPGTYNLNLTVSDGQGGVLSTTTKITILADVPRIEAADAEYILNPKVPLNYSFIFSSKNLNNPASAYSVARTSGLPDVLNGLGLSRLFSQPASSNGYQTSYGGDYQVTYTGIIPTSNKFYQDASVNYRINITDRNGIVYPKAFNIKIIVEQPQLNFDCAVQARASNDYSCLLGSRTQGDHTLSYTATGLPTGMSLSGTNDILLSGRPTPVSSGYPITIKATNEYGASTSKAFALKVNNYCGDGQKQTPNTEGRGGVYNDGYEDCDGATNIVFTPGQSNINAQYGCRTGTGSLIPDPILTNTYCVFKSPLEGGGYCGDTYCQTSINGQPMETCGNCPKDCGTCPCVPNCSGKTCGDNGCGDTCGLCSATTLCNKGNCCPIQANIQTSVDNYQTTYFNGIQVSTTVGTGCGSTCIGTNTANQGCCWRAIQRFDVTVRPGKNVIAVQGIDTGAQFGLAATFNQLPCASMTTSEVTNWRCTGNINLVGSNWIQSDFNDSAWPIAIQKNNGSSGNALYPGAGQIWASDANYSNSTVYCRYTFYSESTSAN